MALVTVAIYRVTSTYSGTYTSTGGPLTYDLGDIFHCVYDTDTDHTTVEFRTSGSGPGAGSLITTALSGPSLTGTGTVELLYPSGSIFYKYCEGTTLWQTYSSGSFPYVGKYGVVNSPYCYIAPTCDLSFSNEYSNTDATGPVNNDGSLEVSATTSYGVIKYNIGNFNYDTAGQTSGVFENLLPGVYTIYAKDEAGCQDTITIEIKVTEVYNVRWRLEFKDQNLHDVRLDILERAYTGSVEEVCGGETPILIQYNGDPNDIYKAVIPSECIIQLMSDYPGKYEEIFSADDRKHRVNVYVNTVGIYEIYWTGYCASEFYREPYLKEPFPIEITAIDCLGELPGKQFLDENDNKYIDDQNVLFIISEILKKSDLKININNSVNIYDAGMDNGNSDDPFAQALIDVRIFYNDTKDCEYVLQSILEPFGAKIFQSKGEWWITRIEYGVTQTLAFRKFDYLGAYISNSIDNPIYTTQSPEQVNRFAWVDRSQVRSFNRNYGTISIVHDLAKDQNLIDSGSFDPEYLVEDGNGNVFFKDWNFSMGQDDQQFGLEILEDGTGAFYNTWGENSSAPQNDSVLSSKEIPFVIVNSTQIIVRFRVKMQFIRNLPYARLGWRFRARNVDTGDFSDVEWTGNVFGYSSSTNEEKINDLYIDVGDSNEWRDIEIGPFNIAPPFSTSNPNVTYQLSFYFHNHRLFDYSDYDDMRARNINYSVRPNDDQRLYFAGDLDRALYYKVDATDAPESEPDVIRPLSYNAATPRQWVLQSSFYSVIKDVLKKIMLDNVQISIYPNELSTTGGYVDPPGTASYTITTSKIVKSTLSKTVVLGDVPVFSNAKEIYRGWIKLLDGTPTSSWARKGVDEDRFLLDILINDYTTQLKDQTQKLSGTGHSDNIIHYLNFYYNHIDTKRHINTNFVYNVKRAEYTIDAVYIKTGETGEPPVTLAGFTEGFSVGFYS
jgi:hypothetical protein